MKHKQKVIDAIALAESIVDSEMEWDGNIIALARVAATKHLNEAIRLLNAQPALIPCSLHEAFKEDCGCL